MTTTTTTTTPNGASIPDTQLQREKETERAEREIMQQERDNNQQRASSGRIYDSRHTHMGLRVGSRSCKGVKLRLSTHPACGRGQQGARGHSRARTRALLKVVGTPPPTRNGDTAVCRCCCGWCCCCRRCHLTRSLPRPRKQSFAHSLALSHSRAHASTHRVQAHEAVREALLEHRQHGFRRLVRHVGPVACVCTSGSSSSSSSSSGGGGGSNRHNNASIDWTPPPLGRKTNHSGRCLRAAQFRPTPRTRGWLLLWAAACFALTEGRQIYCPTPAASRVVWVVVMLARPSPRRGNFSLPPLHPTHPSPTTPWKRCRRRCRRPRPVGALSSLAAPAPQLAATPTCESICQAGRPTRCVAGIPRR